MKSLPRIRLAAPPSTERDAEQTCQYPSRHPNLPQRNERKSQPAAHRAASVIGELRGASPTDSSTDQPRKSREAKPYPGIRDVLDAAAESSGSRLRSALGCLSPAEFDA